MKKLRIYLLVTIIISVVTYISISGWVGTRKIEQEAFYTHVLNRHTTPMNISQAFVLALWLNDPTAYQVTDPLLWKQVDNWMDSHIVEQCTIFDTGEFDGIALDNSPTFVKFSCDMGELAIYDVKTEYNELGKLVIIDWSFDDKE